MTHLTRISQVYDSGRLVLYFGSMFIIVKIGLQIQCIFFKPFMYILLNNYINISLNGMQIGIYFVLSRR